MKLKKIISVLLCLFTTLSLLTGCGSNADEIIYINIPNKPSTLDPQLAETDEELMICRNIYEGLLRKDENGNIVNGASNTYKKDGLTYTFYLKENLIWSNGDKITANDFVFGFKRAVDPNVKSPFANRLKSIKNASDIIAGRASVDTLGVTALSDYSLEIVLEKEDSEFEWALTTSVSMPCNEEFLSKSTGKYGRSAECILSNGSYSLKKWNPDEFGIRLRKNENYKGDFTAKNGGVFISSNSDEKISKLFQKESVDCAIVKSEDFDSVTQTGVKHKSFQNICWFMTIGKSYSATVRSAFLSAVNSDTYKDKLKYGLVPSNSIYPEMLNIGNTADRAGFTDYNIENSKAVFSNIIKGMEDKHFPETVLYYYDNVVTVDALKAILGHWQQNLSAYINITPAKHPEELSKELKDHALQFSLFPIKAKSSSLREYLESFNVDTSLDATTAQTIIMQDKTVFPVCFENTNICYCENIKNLYLESENGYIDFSFATKN